MSINKDLANATQEQEFTEVVNIIVQHKNKASRTINEQSLLCAWYVGGYVSKKLKREGWGSKVVSQLFLKNIHHKTSPCYKDFSY